MKRVLGLALFVGASVVSGWNTSSAEAQYFGYPLNAGIWVNERLPFYAQHPPVYYKRPVSRPYGYSPYAYPPGYTTPERTAHRPEIVIINPFVPHVIAPLADEVHPPQPQVIDNPFAKP